MSTLIYSNIDTEWYGVQYHLRFTNRITALSGDSGSGKTFLYRVLRNIRQFEEYKLIRQFDISDTFNFNEDLLKCSGKFIVIDNADILLNEEAVHFINEQKDNQYLLIGRLLRGVWVSSRTILNVDTQDKCITLQEEF